MKPLIGITCSMGLGIYSMTMENLPQEQHRMNDTYINAIIQAGGVPVVIPAYEDLSLVKDVIDRLDGVLLSGGGDLDPALYSRRPNAHLGSVSPRRDAAEIAIARYVIRETDKPLLGICRGVQVMNVAMGGSLYIDLPDEGKLAHSLTMYPRSQVSHEIDVAENTRLAKAMGAGSNQVNSFHHEAVKDVAEGFVVSASSVPDDVVEAIELPGERFVLGVQWHPEELTARQEARQLFRDFVTAAR